MDLAIHGAPLLSRVLFPSEFMRGRVIRPFRIIRSTSTCQRAAVASLIFNSPRSALDLARSYRGQRSQPSLSNERTIGFPSFASKASRCLCFAFLSFPFLPFVSLCFALLRFVSLCFAFAFPAPVYLVGSSSPLLPSLDTPIIFLDPSLLVFPCNVNYFDYTQCGYACRNQSV